MGGGVEGGQDKKYLNIFNVFLFVSNKRRGVLLLVIPPTHKESVITGIIVLQDTN